MEDEELLALVRDARQLHRASTDESWLVRPSSPVLFFGDLSGFRRSELRVATVALNPSRQEFPVGAPFSRFPGADSTVDHEYLQSLCAYFRTAPYTSWFDFYEQALAGVGTSYYDGGRALALHTDIGSVLPTDPTWSGLDGPIVERLASSGVPLWHRLAAYLEPHILLWSTARTWLDLIEFPPLSPWTPIAPFSLTEGGEARRRPITVEARWYQLPAGAPVLVAFIPASQKPLAGLSHPQKRQAGRIIREYWSRGV